MKTFACIRVGTDVLSALSQRHDIMEYATANEIVIDEFIEMELPGRKGDAGIRHDLLLKKLHEGDTIIVSDLTRLGRSIAQVINIVSALISKKVRFIAIRQNMVISGRQDQETRVIKTMFTLFAQLERDLISERTRQGLEARRSAGIKLGRPKGSTGKSKLDPHKEEIAAMLKHRAPLSYIARVYGVTWPTVENFIRTRNLEQFMSSH